MNQQQGKVETKNATTVFATGPLEVWPSIKTSYFPLDQRRKVANDKKKKMMAAATSAKSQQRKFRRKPIVDPESWGLDTVTEEVPF